MKIYLFLFTLLVTPLCATPQTRSILKGYFETGDTPTQAQFENLIDSLSNTSNNWQLLTSTAVGDTSVVLDRPASPIVVNSLIIIDPFTINAEVRSVSAISSATITVTALKKAHTAGCQILSIDGQSVSVELYGALGNTSDDEPEIQAALDDQWVNAGTYWLSGRNRFYRTFKPLILSSAAKIEHINFKADATYAPVGADNAMLMPSQGNVLTFTAGTDDVITTPSAHGLPSDNIKVMFKNITGMAGITAGQIYYCRDRTATTFKVSATSGGAAVDITSSGSGTTYCEINSMSRIYMRDVYIDGSSVAGITGMYAFLQQPADIWKLRIGNCPLVGLKLGGQDGTFYNVMLINNGVGLAMDNASFFKFYQFNVEQCQTGVTMTTNCPSNLFDGVHMELNSGSGYSDATSIGFDVAAASDLVIRSMHMSMNSATQTVFRSTGAASTVSYSLSNFRFPTGTIDTVVIDDAARGINKRSWTDFRNNLIGPFIAPLGPSSDSYPDHAQINVVGKNGRFVKYGSVDKDMSVFELQGDSDQVGNLLAARNSAGTVVSSITPAGNMSFGLRATPSAAPTIASAGTIAPTAPIVFVSGTTTINTITVPSPISTGGGQITVIPTGVFSTGTGGNISIASTSVVGKALTFYYDVTTGKWYPSY